MARKSRPSRSRPAKMGRKWTKDDLLAYNSIIVVHQDLSTFFCVTDLPPPNDPLTAQRQDITVDRPQVFVNGRMTAVEPDNREPTMIDFVRELFNAIRYWNVPLAPTR